MEKIGAKALKSKAKHYLHLCLERIKKTGQNKHGWHGHFAYTFMCTGRKAAASGHQTWSPATTNPKRYRSPIFFW